MPEKPEKLSLGGNNHNGSAFVLQIASRYGTATAAENASFEIRTTLDVRDTTGNVLARLGPQSDPVSPLRAPEPGTSEAVPLTPQVIAWDPAGFAGTARVTTQSELTQNGNPVAGASAERVDDVEIGTR